ncbi:hypothetical protein [Burkholderia ambifaria]|uniref:hypothetical protein n=1 Tax=Burkholderia ambifaria TaxID=152480 RepID=UPI00158E4755|nr:hypothetical protein [Burkholderia ambifaria]
MTTRHDPSPFAENPRGLAVFAHSGGAAGRILPDCAIGQSTDEKSPAVPGMMRTVRMI